MIRLFAGKDRRRRLRQCEQLARGGLGGLPVVGSHADECRVDREAGCRHRLVVAVEALGGGEDRRLVADHGDPAMPVRERMLHRAACTAHVVEQHDVSVESSGRTVDEHRPCSGTELGQEVAVVIAGRHDQQPVAPPLAEPVDELPLAGRALVRAGRDHE